MNLWTRSYNILKQGIKNLQSIIDQKIDVETGFDEGNNDLYDPEDNENFISMVKSKRSAIKKRSHPQGKQIKSQIDNRKTRDHINNFWWIKFKSKIVTTMIMQNKFEISLKFIEQIKKDCIEYHSNVIERDLIGLQGRIYIK